MITEKLKMPPLKALFLLICGTTSSSTQAQPTQQGSEAYTYYHPSKDKESWQRLNLQQSSTFFVVVSEGEMGHDTSLILASRSLGISRYSVLAEGINDPALHAESGWIDTRNPGIAIRSLSGATGHKRSGLLTLLGAYYAFEPDNYSRYRDSVEYFLTRAIKESNASGESRLRRIAQCLLGKMYVQVNDKKGSIIFDELISDSRKNGDREMTARALAYRGIYTKPTPETFNQKIIDLEAAARLYDSLDNQEAFVNSSTDLAYMLIVTMQLDGAQQALLKALAEADAMRFPYTHYMTDALSLISLLQGKFGDPFRYSLQSMKTATETRDSIGWGFFFTRRADLYFLEGREKESFEMMQRAASRFVTDRNMAVYNVLGTIVDWMGDEGKARQALQLTQEIVKKVGFPHSIIDQFNYNHILSNGYMRLGMLDSAYHFAVKMDSLESKAELSRGPLRRQTVNEQFAYIHFNRGEYLKTKEYLETYFSDSFNIDRRLGKELSNYRMLIRADLALGDKTAALLHYEKYVQLLDSNFRITKFRQAEELGVLYNTQEKEKEIASLNESSALKDANLKQANRLRNLTLGGIAAMIIIAILLYRQNKLRKRNNALISQKNEQLQELLEDREWLLKEIHHRVKNNLQIVTSLLSSQAVYINNEAAHAAIQDSKRRVFAMSLIHQKLYQSNNIATISMPGYVNELIMHVQTSLGSGNRVAIEQDIAALNLDVSQAIPLGLIINECVVNSIKYAFPDNARGLVMISLQKKGADHLSLTIADNGIGLPLDFDISEQNSLGMELVRGLAKQLKGQLNIESENGLHIKIRFALLQKQIEDTSATIN
ncbi:MAG: histidine kinase dimerization/phosphoacceptor domain -containing protein [Chitinophagaceae bacterium]